MSGKLHEDLISLEELSLWINVQRQTIHRWIRARRFPPPIRFGPRLLRWRKSDVVRWLTAQSCPTETASSTA